MIKAILAKEFYKTKRTFIICLFVAVFFIVYVALMMNRVSVNKGVEHIWLIMLMKDNMFVDTLKYLPTIIAIALGVAQMAPEMTQKRLKLTLHLPYSQNRLISIMLTAGVAELLIIYLIQIAVLLIYDSTFLPVELVKRVFLTALPWYLAGITAYFFTTAICLEGTWKNRIIIALIGLALLYPYFVQSVPEAYNKEFFLLVLFSFSVSILTFHSIYRFKEGVQD